MTHKKMEEKRHHSQLKRDEKTNNSIQYTTDHKSFKLRRGTQWFNCEHGK